MKTFLIWSLILLCFIQFYNSLDSSQPIYTSSKEILENQQEQIQTGLDSLDIKKINRANKVFRVTNTFGDDNSPTEGFYKAPVLEFGNQLYLENQFRNKSIYNIETDRYGNKIYNVKP